MLRLTLRSGRDGRFLACCVEQQGTVFVLDQGDARIISDVSQRIAKGFTIWRDGQVVAVGPQSPDLLSQLADFYVEEGLLVFYDEPGWANRNVEAEPPPIPDDFPVEFTDTREQTEILSAREAAARVKWTPPARSRPDEPPPPPPALEDAFGDADPPTEAALYAAIRAPSTAAPSAPPSAGFAADDSTEVVKKP